MKKRVLILLAAIMAMATSVAQNYDFSAVAPSGQTLYYKISTDSTTVSLVRPSSSLSSYVSGDLIIPDSVTYNGNRYAVVSMLTLNSRGAFEICELTSVVIPNTMTGINNRSFNTCEHLVSAIIPNTVTGIYNYAFSGCLNLCITIPNTVTTIGNYAFRNVKYIEYHGSATGAPWGAIRMNGERDGDFLYEDTAHSILKYYLGNDTSVVIPSNVTVIGNSVFYGSSIKVVSIPNSVTEIGDSAFYGCRLTSVTLPNSLLSIGNYAFYGCCLTSLTIPNSVTSIGDCAFANCTSLTSVIIPNSVTSIGSSVFYWCHNLTSPVYTNTIFVYMPYYNGSSYTIPDGITTICGGAFAENTHLSVIIPNSVTVIGNYAFGGVRHIEYHGTATGAKWGALSMNGVTDGNFIYEDSSHTVLVMYLGNDTSVTIPSTVTAIGDSAFIWCSGMTSVIIPDSVTSIGDGAFNGCRGLSTISIPDAVDSFGNYIFKGCTGLTSPVYNNSCFIYMPTDYSGSYIIPEGITKIIGTAFNNCSGLTSVTIPASVTYIGKWAFTYCCILDSVFLLPETPPTIVGGRWQCFNNNFSCAYHRSFYVPCGYAQNYATSWGGSYVEPSVDFSMTLTVNDSTFGSAVIIQQYGGVDVYCDSSVIVFATANEHYLFDHWSNGRTANPDTLYLDGDSAVTAFFSLDQHIITATTNIAGAGSIQGVGTYNYGDTVTLTAIANYGYTFTQWSDGSTANPRTIIVTSDTLLTALFAPNPYTVTTTTDLEDTLYGETRGSIVYNFGDTVWLGAYAKMHCRFEEWSDGNTENPRMLVVSSDTSFTAHFAPRDTVYEYFAPEVIRDTVVIVDTVYISTKSVAAMPDVSTTNVTDNNTYEPISETSGRKDGNYGGLFSYNDMTYIPDGPDCSDTAIVGIMVSGFTEGQQIQSPEDIFSVCVNIEHSYLGDLEISLLCPSYSDNDTTGHGKAVLKYKNEPQGIQIPNGTWGGGGRFLGIPYGGSNHHNSYDGSTATEQRCNSYYNPYGLGYDYCFSRNGSRTLVNGQPANTPLPNYAALVNVTLDTVTYNFPPIPTGFNGAGNSCGEVTVTTPPASNREEGTGFYVPASDFTSLVGCPVNGEWRLEIRDYLGVDNGWIFSWNIDFGNGVYVSSQDTALGNVEGYGFSASATQTRVAAMPKAGNYFMGWSDGSEDNPYNLTIFGDTTLVAYFAERDSLVIYDTLDTLYIHDTIYIHDTLYVGIADVSVLNAKVYSSNGQIVIEGAEGNTVTLFDVNGRMLATKHDGTPLRFDVPASGTYMIKIGDYPARKVVVIR